MSTHGMGTTRKFGAHFLTAQNFMEFFNEKVDAVRHATEGVHPESELPPAPAVL